MSPLCGQVDVSDTPMDPAAGLGPRTVSSRDGRVHLVADVRLDNREELAACLKTDTDDTGLVLAAYLRWGAACPEHLLGDFAFVVWDGGSRRIFCARDPLGIKPLHYARAGRLLVFGSEARQVLGHPTVPRRLDEVTVADHLAGCLPEPDRSFFRDVHRLPPGHRLAAGPDGEQIERWWDLNPERRIVYRRDEEYAEHFLDLLRQAVASRLPRDGAAGILLSGGLDSGSVAALARQALPAGGPARLFALSFIFDRLRQCDERDRIRATAESLGLESSLVRAERFPMLGDPEACRPPLDSPLLSWEGCFREMLGLARARGARVLLTGHGGDDLLSGSPYVYADRLRRGDLRAVAEVARHAANRGPDWRWVLYNYLARPLLPHSIHRSLRRLSGRAAGPEIPDWIEPALVSRTDLSGRIDSSPPRRFQEAARQAVDDRLRQTPWSLVVDWYARNAAPFGIEMRHPFLDRRLVELVTSIPPEQTFRADLSKPLLRRAVTGLLPDAVRLQRSRTRLGAFLDMSLREQRERVERLLAPPLLSEEAGFVSGDRLRAAYHRFCAGQPDEAQRALWYAITLEIWLRQHAAFMTGSQETVESRSAA